MTYIINYCDFVCICRGHNELTTCLNSQFRKGYHLIESIIPLQYCEWLYIVYEWDATIHVDEPVRNQNLYERIDYIKQEGGNILNIYNFMPFPR